MAAIRIGVSGWRYAPWRGRFYPEGLPQRAELQHLSRVFSTVEINGSFYSLQRPESYERWYADTPDGFIFGVKGPRYITHMLRLREIEQPLANFFASGLFNLREKLGPILWQLPPAFKYDHVQDASADFAYLRLHGEKEMYRSGYSERALERWARRIRAWHEGSEPADIRSVVPRSPGTAKKPRDVYCYFDNTDVKLRAPVDARSLMRKLGVGSHAPRRIAGPAPGGAAPGRQTTPVRV